MAGRGLFSGLFRKKLRVAVLVSGRGSNLGAILKAEREKRITGAKTVLVISDNRDAYALEIARRYGVKAVSIPAANFKTKLEGEPEARYIRALQEAKIDLVVLAGFMRVLKPAFIRAFRGRILNIHPSLLPKYPGLHTHQRALEAGDREAGCTVHFVSEVVDGGKRIIQARVPILPVDNADSLARRVLEREHVILPRAIQLFADGKIDEAAFPDQPIAG
jgi:phosphoribosylglycinamide formyltransferase-1